MRRVAASREQARSPRPRAGTSDNYWKGSHLVNITKVRICVRRHAPKYLLNLQLVGRALLPAGPVVLSEAMNLEAGGRGFFTPVGRNHPGEIQGGEGPQDFRSAKPTA